MVPLGTTQRVLKWYCVIPSDPLTSRCTRSAHFALTCMTIVCNWIVIGSSVAFCVKYMLTDMINCLYALFQIMAALPMTNAIIATFFLRQRIAGIFGKLSKIYEIVASKEGRECLIKANERSEWMWKNCFKFYLGGFFVNTILVALGSVAICWYMRGVFDIEYVLVAYKLILPWDQSTPLGYFGEVCVDIVLTEPYLLMNASLLLTFIGICLHNRAFYEIFQCSIRELSESKGNQYDRVSLYNLIYFHNMVKDWFLETSDVYGVYITAQLVFGMLYLACTVFHLDLAFQHIDFNIVTLVMAAIVSGSNLFLYCFFGKMATESFLSMGDCLYESNWQNLSIQLQKNIRFMIQYTQTPIYYRGWGLNATSLNLQTFTKLIRAVGTYYMAFKTITAD